MAKGYWIGRVDVHNEEGYKPYAAANPAIFKKFGGRFVVRAGKYENPEGGSRSRNVVIEFPDYAAALAGYKAYMAATPPAHEKYHGTALVRGGKMEVAEGRARSRNVIREFPDYASALACYRSAEYQ